MIWLAVVGTLNQSNTITMMSLLWWGALANQNHSWTAGVYHRRLPREFTMGGYRGSLLREVTVGIYHGRLPQEFIAGGWMIWLAVVGTLNQSNGITMMSLLWWGALANQNYSWTMGVYCGRLPREVTAEVSCGRSPQEFTVGVYCRRLPREVTTGVYCGRSLWEFTMGGYCGRLNDLIGCGGDT